MIFNVSGFHKNDLGPYGWTSCFEEKKIQTCGKATNGSKLGLNIHRSQTIQNCLI